MASQTDKMTRSGWVMVGLVSLGVIFTALDQTVVVTVLPEMMVDLEIGVTELDHASWIVTGYLLGYTVAIPLVARMADVYGHSLVLRVSLLVFAVGSAMGGTFAQPAVAGGQPGDTSLRRRRDNSHRHGPSPPTTCRTVARPLRLESSARRRR